MSDPRQDPLRSLMAQRDGAMEAVRKALQPIVPAGFYGKFTITVDNGRIDPHHVSVELRKSAGVQERTV